jgi:hypothetical protein
MRQHFLVSVERFAIRSSAASNVFPPADLVKPVIGVGVPPALAHRFVVDDHHFRAAEGVEPQPAELAADSGILPAAEGQSIIVDQRVVDSDHASFQPFGRGHVIGPVVANNQADGVAVIRPHVIDHAGRFLRLDTREKDSALPEFLARSGLPVYDTVTTPCRSAAPGRWRLKARRHKSPGHLDW